MKVLLIFPSHLEWFKMLLLFRTNFLFRLFYLFALNSKLFLNAIRKPTL